MTHIELINTLEQPFFSRTLFSVRVTHSNQPIPSRMRILELLRETIPSLNDERIIGITVPGFRTFFGRDNFLIQVYGYYDYNTFRTLTRVTRHILFNSSEA